MANRIQGTCGMELGLGAGKRYTDASALADDTGWWGWGREGGGQSGNWQHTIGQGWTWIEVSISLVIFLYRLVFVRDFISVSLSTKSQKNIASYVHYCLQNLDAFVHGYNNERTYFTPLAPLPPQSDDNFWNLAITTIIIIIISNWTATKRHPMFGYYIRTGWW